MQGTQHAKAGLQPARRVPWRRQDREAWRNRPATYWRPGMTNAATGQRVLDHVC